MVWVAVGLVHLVLLWLIYKIFTWLLDILAVGLVHLVLLGVVTQSSTIVF